MLDIVVIITKLLSICILLPSCNNGNVQLYTGLFLATLMLKLFAGIFPKSSKSLFEMNISAKTKSHKPVQL